MHASVSIFAMWCYIASNIWASEVGHGMEGACDGRRSYN